MPSSTRHLHSTAWTTERARMCSSCSAKATPVTIEANGLGLQRLDRRRQDLVPSRGPGHDDAIAGHQALVLILGHARKIDGEAGTVLLRQPQGRPGGRPTA